jgi:hypothetical protein
MNFSEWRGPATFEGEQSILFAESADLVHWTRLGPDCEFVPDLRWYLGRGGWKTRWDSINPLPRAGGGLYGYWTAVPSAFHPGVGFGETEDGVHWTAREPPLIDWGDRPRMDTLECAAVEMFAGRIYALLGRYGGYADRASGMYQFVADRPEGPFRPVEHNYEVLTSPLHLRMSYFPRFCRTGGEVLVNHQVMSRLDERYLAPLKTAVVDAGGTLRLGWWRGNEALKGERLSQTVTVSPFAFDPLEGGILEGRIGGLAAEGTAGEADAYLETEGDAGVLIRIHAGGMVDVDLVAHGRHETRREDRIDRALEPRPDCSFRLLARRALCELYVDDVLMQAFSLPGRWTGSVDLRSGGASFAGLAGFRMSLDRSADGGA